MTKNDIKEIQSLRLAKTRKESGLFTTEGNKLVEELSNSGLMIENIFATELWVMRNTDLADKLRRIELISSKGQ